MPNFNIGDKVRFGGNFQLTGYIVKIEIDPFEEIDVNFDKKNYVFYTIRVYKDFYIDGYSDFQRTENDMIKVED